VGGREMKLYVHKKGIILVGKAWEIREKLIEYQQHYDGLQDWIQSIPKEKSS